MTYGKSLFFLKYITSHTKYCALLDVGQCLFECVSVCWLLDGFEYRASMFSMGSQLWWAFLLFWQPVIVLCYFLCLFISLYCTLANKYDMMFFHLCLGLIKCHGQHDTRQFFINSRYQLWLAKTAKTFSGVLAETVLFQFCFSFVSVSRVPISWSQIQGFWVMTLQARITSSPRTPTHTLTCAVVITTLLCESVILLWNFKFLLRKLLKISSK